MSELRNNQCLSYGDSIFIFIEREGSPMNVASVCTFEGEISGADCVRFIESKIPLIPRYRQRLVTAPFNLGLPMWEFDPNFDVSNHVHEVTMKHGTEAELKEIAGKVFSTFLDRSRPLWDLTLIHGVKGNRTGLIVRVHHALADGVSGVGLLNAIMDTSPEVPKLPKRKPRFDAPPPRDVLTLMVDGFMQSCFSMTDRVLTIQSNLLNIAEHIMTMFGIKPTEQAAAPEQNGENGNNGFSSNANSQLTGAMAKLGAELVAPVERLPFNTVVRGPERFAWTSIPLPEIKAVKNAVGATVNDVLLAVITRTLRRYAELHGVHNKLAKIVVPVNVRAKDAVGELGNRITFLPLAVPLNIDDPKELILAVRERMGFLKGARMGELVGMAGVLIETIPTPLQAVLLPVINELPISLANTICTNVPGPQVPLYFLGHKMLATYPHVPIGSEMGMNSAILTYNGVAYIGFTGNAKAIPDLAKLEELTQSSFAEIRQAFGVRPERATKRVVKPRAKTTRPRKKKAANATVAAEPVIAPAPPQEVAVEAAPPAVKAMAAAGD